MGIKAFLVGLDEAFLMDMAYDLQDQWGWEPLYITSVLKCEQDMPKRFPQTIFHDAFDAMAGKIPADLSNMKLMPLDQEILTALSPYERAVLSMMDRFDSDGTFVYEERIRFYYLQLRYWLAVLERYKPNVVVFASVPHMGYDYILYILCKWLNIQTIIFQYTAFPHISMVLTSLENSYPVTRTYKQMLSGKMKTIRPLTKLLENYLEKLCVLDKAGPVAFSVKYLTPSTDNFNKIKRLKLIGKLYDRCRDYYGLIKSISSQPTRKNYFKRAGENMEDKQLWTDFEFKMYKFKGKKKKEALSKYYDSLISKPDLNKPFIYIPLHYQPECSTVPLGGYFVEQLLMIDILSKTIPDDWRIYVKECINQFLPKLKGEQGRTMNFYKDVAVLKNVVFASEMLNTFTLLDHAQAVATVTGTVGLEAVVRKKPVLVFGRAWYRGCEGVYFVQTVRDCQKAIEDIKKGVNIDYNKVKLFLCALEESGAHVYLNSKCSEPSGLSVKENKDRLVKILKSMVAGH